MDWFRKLFAKDKTGVSNMTESQPENIDDRNFVQPDESGTDQRQDSTGPENGQHEPEGQEGKGNVNGNLTEEEQQHTQVAAIEMDPVDAWAELEVAADGMSASMVLHGPESGGREIDLEAVEELLKSRKIVYGINYGLLSRMVRERRYGEEFIAAAGVPAKNGVDGRIIELLPRTKQISFIENEKGNVDFKNLNIVNQVEQGTAICEIIQPEDPVTGMNIYGNEIPGKPGSMPAIPNGDNTYLSEDGTKLIAAITGNLTFSNNRFSVRQQFDVPENVDASTGNIEFAGDVIIRGSVLEGYTVKAGGNVTVYGMVEGAQISAGGNVQLKQGINGMGKGIIEANGDITSRFFENCTVKAGGSVSTEYILHSNIYSGNSINVTGARSSIIGGTCSALKSIIVTTIGNRMNTMTTIMLGATTEMIEERKTLMAEVNELERKLNNLKLDSQFIEERIREKALAEKHREILLRIQKEYPEVSQRLDECRSRLFVLDELISNNRNARLTCRQIYPPTRIIIGGEVIIIQEERYRCEVYYSDGEIKFAYR